jgi:hypothetical protein
MKIHVRREPASLSVSVFLYEKSLDGRFITVYNVNESGQLTPSKPQPHDPGTMVDWKPLFTTNEDTWRLLLQEFLSLAKRDGVPMPDENYAKGKLEAQSEHLKDLRTMLKL